MPEFVFCTCCLLIDRQALPAFVRTHLQPAVTIVDARQIRRKSADPFAQTFTTMHAARQDRHTMAAVVLAGPDRVVQRVWSSSYLRLIWQQSARKDVSVALAMRPTNAAALQGLLCFSLHKSHVCRWTGADCNTRMVLLIFHWLI